MARSRNLLERFRPAGTPGAAAKPGVPADHTAELASELEPVLARLRESVEEADAIRAQGAAEAQRIRHEGTERARAVTAQGRRDAEVDRAEAALHVTERADRESAETLAAAQQEAAAVRLRGQELLPEYADRVLATVRGWLQEAARRPPDEDGLV